MILPNRGNVVAVRRVTFRLYPKPKTASKLLWARKMHQLLYNAAICNRKVQYEKFGHSVSYLEQQNSLPAFKEVWPEYKDLGSHTLQATLKRVDLAYQSFFRKLRGKPKFKSIRHYGGWTYPDKAGWKVRTNGNNGYLELTDLKLSIQMRGRARTWGVPTTCTIVYRNGLWYASITVECNPVRATDTGAVGLDFGVYHAVAMSDGTIVDHPRFLTKSQSKIKRVSKQKRRKRAPHFRQKVKASKRFRKASLRVRKLQRQVANERQDWTHKVAAEIVVGAKHSGDKLLIGSKDFSPNASPVHSLVATEELNLKGSAIRSVET